MFISLCGIYFLNGQGVANTPDYPLFPRMKGFKMLEYDVTEPASYRFVDMDGKEIIVSGRLLYYYYESDNDMSPSKILETVSARAKELTAQFCGHDGNKLCMIIQQDNVEVWADISAGEFYYTIRLIERAEINQEISAESIRTDLETKGESTLYIRFAYRRDEILPYSVPAINALAEVLKGNPGWKIEIEGHTESGGSELENRKISFDRAMSIAEMLIKGGIDKERLICTGMGDTMPVSDKDTPEGKALNRRIVIKKK